MTDDRRHAAVVATVVTGTLAVVCALGVHRLLSGDSSQADAHAVAVAELRYPAPPYSARNATSCTRLIERLPVSLVGLAPRLVSTRPETPYVLAWGNPAIVLRCGVAKPADLKPGSGVELRSGGSTGGLFYDLQERRSTTVWTAVDRAPFISVEIPTRYQPASFLPAVSAAILTLPAVCSTDSSAVDAASWCTRRR